MIISSSATKDALLPQQGIKRYFHVQRFCFARIGIDPTSFERTYISYALVWIPFMSMFTLCFPIILDVKRNIHDLDAVTHALSPFWQASISIFKLMYFVWNRKQFIELIRKLWLLNLEAKGAENVILAVENRKDLLFCTFYHIAAVITCSLAVVRPFMIAGFHSYRGQSFWEYLEPPLRADYFISENTLLGYIIVFVWNVAGVYFTGYCGLSTDSLFSWFMCNIVAQFRILKHRIRLAGEENNGNCSLQTITAFIVYHSRAIEIVSDFNDVFSIVVFLKFIISCVQICCVVFQFSRGGELADQVFHFSFFITVSVQLMLYCYGGQMVKDESASVANQIFESFRWESMSMKGKKMLIVTMMRAQQPCNVSGIFFTVDLNLYLWVFRTAASYITLLRTLDDQEEGSQ